MAKLLAISALLLCFSAAFGRKCYTCVSTVSLDDCNNKKTEMTCPSGYDRCGTLSVEFNVLNVESKSFTRVCSSQAECDDASAKLKNCKQANGTCSFECCDSDLCSGSSGSAVPVVSTLLMLACAFVKFFG
ncbi:uncharacterized protein LOC110057300 isoform X2 [Orbicella faveolata]|uniref:uncharacterized protein LOC110057300 isoform X2 n=1 Tax=Orbicella faveolata TaxID=48498 RepID=UPI0009E35D4B|nr:uncharacterized protein LOC110057300 isoform X2 [Orbicella faveolata]